MQAHGLGQPDGCGAEELDAGAAEKDAVGFDGEVDPIAVEGVGGNVDFVVDFVGGLGNGFEGPAFGKAQAGALG
jgi:hypothetical protein